MTASDGVEHTAEDASIFEWALPPQDTAGFDAAPSRCRGKETGKEPAAEFNESQAAVLHTIPF